MSEPADTVLYWYWRHSALSVREHETVEEAARDAWGDSERGEAAFVCIEVAPVGKPTDIVDPAEVGAIWRRLEAEQDAPLGDSEPATHAVRLAAPGHDAVRDGDSATVEWVRATDEAGAAFARWNRRFPGRVTLHEVR